MDLAQIAFLHASIYVAAGLSGERNRWFLTCLAAMNVALGFGFMFSGK